MTDHSVFASEQRLYLPVDVSVLLPQPKRNAFVRHQSAQKRGRHGPSEDGHQ